MTYFVCFIAALHALPPIILANLMGRFGNFLGTAIAIAAAIFLGGGAYTFFDLIGVAIGYFIAKACIDDDNTKDKKTIRKR